MTHPLECMDCEWVMPMGTGKEFESDLMAAHCANTGHLRYSRRGDPPISILDPGKIT